MTFFSGLDDSNEILLRAPKLQPVQHWFGRVKIWPANETEEQLKLAKKLLRQGESIHYVADTFGIHFTTLYRYLRESNV